MRSQQNKYERKQAMEDLLQHSHEGYTMEELGQRFEMDASTAHRNLQEIRQEREVIEVSHGRYRLDPTQSLSNVSLYPDEALMIYLALRKFIRQTGKATTFMLSAMDKIVPALKRPDLRNILNQSLKSLEAERPASHEYTNVWRTLLRGWREDIVVRIEYQKAGDDMPTVHEIEPYLFEPMPLGDGIYVIAFSQTRNELRTFKPDRILRATLTTAKFQRRQDLSPDQLLKHAWGIWYGKEPTTVKLWFSAGVVASRVMETKYLPTERKQLLPDGTLLWEAEVVGTVEILSWIRGWGPGVEVIQPSELREKIRAELEETLARYTYHTRL